MSREGPSTRSCGQRYSGPRRLRLGNGTPIPVWREGVGRCATVFVSVAANSMMERRSDRCTGCRDPFSFSFNGLLVFFFHPFCFSSSQSSSIQNIPHCHHIFTFGLDKSSIIAIGNFSIWIQALFQLFFFKRPFWVYLGRYYTTW
ncbi:hypothetical protein V8F06_002020 [Rhypophila decipiens]